MPSFVLGTGGEAMLGISLSHEGRGQILPEIRGGSIWGGVKET